MAAIDSPARHLPDRRVLRVDRSEPGERAGERDRPGALAATAAARCAGERHDEVTAGDERLLVGGRHDLAGGQRGQDRAEADDPAGPDDDEVDVVAGRERSRGRPARLRPSSRPAGRAERRRRDRRGARRRPVGAGGPGSRAARPGDRSPGRPPGRRVRDPAGRRRPDGRSTRRSRAGRPGSARRARVVGVTRGTPGRTGSSPARRTGTNRSDRARRRGPGSGGSSPWPRPLA